MYEILKMHNLFFLARSMPPPANIFCVDRSKDVDEEITTGVAWKKKAQCLVCNSLSL